MNKVRTDQPQHRNIMQITQRIARFWDNISEAWHKIWGPHIHHGFYDETNQTPIEAQEKLLVKLTELLSISPHSHVLDVGCGMGGSSLFIAEKFQTTVIGITLSKKQITMANRLAKLKKIHHVYFAHDDAHTLARFKDAQFDVVWSLESCEQFYDKASFVHQAKRVLKNNGVLMLATWCSNQSEYEGKDAKDYLKLCKSFDLPYMPTGDYYHELLIQNGFKIEKSLDWTSSVAKSWSTGISLLKKYSFLGLLKFSGLRGLRFARQIYLMRNGFESGKVRYKVFIAVKQDATDKPVCA